VYQAETRIKTLEYKAREYATRTVSQAKAQAYEITQLADTRYHQMKTLAEARAKSFEKWVELAQKMKARDPYYLNAVWWNQVPELYSILRGNGQIGLLDQHLGPGGLDFTLVPLAAPKK
jgi:hypothetical protein